MSGAESTLQLRPLEGADASAVYDLFCVPQVYRYLADGQAPTRALTDQWVSEALREREEHELGAWALTDRASLVGLVRLAYGIEASRDAELTYVLHPEHWGQGLATEMGAAVIEHGFSCGLTSITAGFDVPNAASGRVLERLGFTFARKIAYPAGPGREYVLQASDECVSRLRSRFSFRR